jgi:phospholipid/cholesterol/gamma-HCH transport system substrate-binding protein
MYSKVNYTLIGIVLIVLIAGAIYFGFWLMKYGLKEKSYNYYQIYFEESVNGLSVDSSVKLNGVNVGKVAEISIDSKDISRVRVLLKIDSKVPVTKSLYGELNLLGITGLSYIELKKDNKLLDDQILKTSKQNPAKIPSKPSITSQLMTQAPKILSKMQIAIDSFNSILTDKNIQSLSSIISSTKDASKKAIVLEDSYISLAKELNLTVVKLRDDINQTIKNLNSITSKVDNKIDSLISKVEKSADSINILSRNINKRLKRGEYDLKKIIRPMEVDIRELSYQYQELANSLKSIAQNPTSVIFGAKRRGGPGE